jgi:hypothetical protein
MGLIDYMVQTRGLWEAKKNVLSALKRKEHYEKR